VNPCYHFETGSSVSIVSGYGLGDLATEVRPSVQAKGFFLWPLCPARLWGPPSLLYKGYQGPSPELKRGRGVTLTTHPHLVPRSRMSRSCIPIPTGALVACSGTALACSFTTMKLIICLQVSYPKRFKYIQLVLLVL
jgi:hypothetical protein